MEDLDTNPVTADLAMSSSRITSRDISHDFVDLTQFLYYNHGAYVGDGPMGMAANNGRVWVNPSITSTGVGQIGQGGDILSPSHYLEFTSGISNAAPDSTQSFISHIHSVPYGGPSASQTDGVDPQLFLFDTEGSTLPPSSNGSTPSYGDQTSPVSIGGLALFPDVNALGPISTFSSGEDPELDIEQTSLSERPLRLPEYHCATISPPISDGGHNVDEGEEGEEEVEDKSSAGSVGQSERSSPPLMGDLTTSSPEIKGEEEVPPILSFQDEAATSAPTDDLPCPGLSGKNKADTKSALNNLLAMAEADGAEARKAGLSKITQNGGTSKCIECGKTNRRDRILDHVLFKHLDLRTWSCPLCRKGYTTRDALSQHLKATKVTCLCHKQITKNNWYVHSKQCGKCSSVTGGLRIEKGRVVTVDQTAPQAGPSVQRSSAHETETGSQECNPRTQRRSPDVGRNVKRKALEVDDESGGEVEEERISKRVKHGRT